MAKPGRRYGFLIGAAGIGLGLLAGILLAPVEGGITADLPDDPTQMAVVWNDRVQTAFPDGTPVATLVSQLLSAKFLVADDQRSASRQRGSMFGVCSNMLFLRWSADGDRAAQVEGSVLTC